MDKTEYITKCEAFLLNNSVYQHLSKDTSQTIHTELIKILQDYKINNFISETEYTQLRPHGSNSPAARFYGLHFVAQQHTTLPNSSLKFFQNYCGKTSSFDKDSTDIIKKIKHLSINPEEESLVSLHVRALFTSIPIPVALQVINSKISTCHQFHQCLQDSYRKIHQASGIHFNQLHLFCFNMDFYKQLQGVARGSPVSPVTANIYMEYFESLTIPSSPTLIKWWFSYVDDVHSATRKDQVNQLHKHLNSIDLHIKFTTELPGTDGTPLPRYPDQTHS